MTFEVWLRSGGPSFKSLSTLLPQDSLGNGAICVVTLKKCQNSACVSFCRILCNKDSIILGLCLLANYRAVRALLASLQTYGTCITLVNETLIDLLPLHLTVGEVR